MIADRRLYVDRDWSRLVEENDPASAWLLAGKGQEIAAEKVRRLGLVKMDGRVMQAGQIMAPEMPAPAEESVAYGDMAAQGVSPAPAMEPEMMEPIMPPESRRRRRKN